MTHWRQMHGLCLGLCRKLAACAPGDALRLEMAAPRFLCIESFVCVCVLQGTIVCLAMMRWNGSDGAAAAARGSHTL